jgi:hypothetical protein
MLHGGQEPIGLERHAPCEARIESGSNVPNCDSPAGFQVAMSSSDRPEQTPDDGLLADDKPACVALVPVLAAAHWPRVPARQLSRADFVTQLIATAEHVPQTRSLRRATPADAKAAYGAPRHNAPVPTSGSRTRQIV